MSSRLPRFPPRSAATFGLLFLLGAADLWAQAPTAPPTRRWTFDPVLSLSMGYDSNIVYAAGASPGDYFGGLGVRAPLSGRLGRNSSLSLNYSANGEWYRELSLFDAFPSRQNGSLGWTYSPGEAWSLGLDANYGESRRPEDLYPETGAGYLRGKTRNLATGASFGRKLGQETRFDLGYTYGRMFYEALELGDRLAQKSESHGARASLGRQLSTRSSLSLRYLYQLYLREGIEDDRSHVVGLGYTVGLGRATTLSLFAGARLQGGDVRPDTSASLSHSWRTSQVSLGYSRTRNYIPTTRGFTETDSANLTYSLTRRRFQASLGAGYSRNRPEDQPGEVLFGQDFESWRGSLSTAYMLARWLGLGATYQYNGQRSGDARLDDRVRHLGQVGLVIAPWSAREPQGLR